MQPTRTSILTTMTAAIALSLAPSTLAQPADLPEPISFTHTQPVGQSAEFRVERSLNLAQSQQDQPDRAIEASISLELTLTRQPDANNGSHIFDININSASIIDRHTLGEEIVHDHTATTPIAPGADESLAAFANTISDATLSLAVSPDGIITTLAGIEPIRQAWFERTGTADTATLGLLTPDALIGAIQPIFNADGAAPQRRPGAGWQTEDIVELPPVGAIVLFRSMSLSEPEDNLATIKTNLEAELRIIPNDDPTAVQLELQSAQGSANLIWDLDTQSLTNRTARETITTQWTVGERAMTQTQQSINNLTRLDAP